MLIRKAVIFFGFTFLMIKSALSCGSATCGSRTFANSAALSQHRGHCPHYQEQFRRHRQFLRDSTSSVLPDCVQEPPAKRLKSNTLNSSSSIVQVSIFFTPAHYKKLIGLPTNRMKLHLLLIHYLRVLEFRRHQEPHPPLTTSSLWKKTHPLVIHIP